MTGFLRILRGRLFIPLTALSAMALGCGGSGGTATPVEPSAPVFTRLELLPSSAALFNTGPGSTLGLSATPRDQAGRAMTGLGSPTFTSREASVATVSTTGVVTALALGHTEVSASLTADGTTKTAITSIEILQRPPSASVDAPGFFFVPATVDVRVGGTVTWNVGNITHNITFDEVSGAPANINAVSNDVQSRSFETSGSFGYQCTIHSGMRGSVRVY